MRPLLLTTVLALALVATPVLAEEPTDPVSEPCEVGDDVDFLLTADGVSETIPTPALPSPYPLGLGGEPDPAGFQAMATDVYTVLVDVNPDHLSAVPSVALEWSHDDDIDMDVYDDQGNVIGESHAFNPLDGNSEQAMLPRRQHCSTFDIHVRNYIAGPGDIALSLGVSSLKA